MASYEVLSVKVGNQIYKQMGERSVQRYARILGHKKSVTKQDDQEDDASS